MAMSVRTELTNESNSQIVFHQIKDSSDMIEERPATAALERCLKRRRTESPTDAFSFTEIFNNLCSEDEVFPVISCDLNDDDEECDKGAGPTLKPTPSRSFVPVKATKKHKGLSRCKSYISGLSLLSEQAP